LEWEFILILMFVSLLFLFFSGLPVAFAFLFITMLGAIWFWGGTKGLHLLIFNIRASLSSFSLSPLPMFILMGEIMFLSGLGSNIIGAVDKWMGNVPGRLSLLAVGAGTLLSFLSGVTIATTAILGSTLVPEMEARGYKKEMSLGPILGSGGLAMMIPPSGLAVLLATVGEISIAKLLISIILPGLLMGLLYGGYIVVRSILNPSLAPPYHMVSVSFKEKVFIFLRHILPLGVIVFLVIGLILIGFATPSEAAATGAMGSFILAFTNRRLNWEVTKKILLSTARTTIMIFMIIAGAVTFGQILAFSGAIRGLIEVTLALDLNPILVVVLMQVIVLFLGCFLEPGSIIMITIPLFMPIIHALKLNPVWFGVIMLLNIEMGMTTPPFGLGLFVMRSVAPTGTTLTDCYKAALPFLGCDLMIMMLIITFPQIVLWLPAIMR